MADKKDKPDKAEQAAKAEASLKTDAAAKAKREGKARQAQQKQAAEEAKASAAVTLRREKMWEFFDRLVNISLPRVRDFRGVSDKAFDGRGNYSLGLKEHTIFPELNLDKVEKV